MRIKGDILFLEREYPPYTPKRKEGGEAAPQALHEARGPFSFTKENGPLEPQEKGFDIASEQLEELQCLPIALPIARRSRVGCC